MSTSQPSAPAHLAPPTGLRSSTRSVVPTASHPWQLGGGTFQKTGRQVGGGGACDDGGLCSGKAPLACMSELDATRISEPRGSGLGQDPRAPGCHWLQPPLWVKVCVSSVPVGIEGRTPGPDFSRPSLLSSWLTLSPHPDGRRSDGTGGGCWAHPLSCHHTILLRR